MRAFSCAMIVLTFAACSPRPVDRPGSDAGSAKMAGTDAPVEFSAAAPQYPGSRIITTLYVPSSETSSLATHMATLETDEPVETVFAFYKDKLARSGLSLALNTLTPEHAALSALGGTPESALSITCVPNDDKTLIMISATADMLN
jgi:hypothetical protein